MKTICKLVVASTFALFSCATNAVEIGPSGALKESTTSVETAQHALTANDANTWLDGFLPYALSRGDIAGAVVVVVKDGKILTQRGFGYADLAARKKVDPDTTMFRVGSTSKLFTWTAVMQLVEQGKIDLDADVNKYLDFKIPVYEGKPITMRNIMTHTPGFDDVIKDGFSYSGKVDPLGDVVKRMLPRRVFVAGTTPAYSNYATALAGYIVERVSGIPFNTYIEHSIFQPLGMNHSSFRQPLPNELAPFMATGYPKASLESKPFELISVPPAGSLSMSGTDGAKFMMAHLDKGRGLLKPETAQMMQTPRDTAIPGLNRMALGFYEQRINDTFAIAHGGDLINFHGYMWLFPEKNVGLFFVMNSAGADQAPYILRQALFDRFADRYFPAENQSALVELGTAKEHARLLEGSYVSSRASFTTFLDIGNLLGQLKVGLDQDGRPLVPELFGEPPRKWIEVAPFVWQDACGHARLGAVVENGKVIRWSLNEVSPFMVFDRVPWYRDATWLMPLLMASLALILVTALSWPIGVMLQKHYGSKLVLAANLIRARRQVSFFGWLVVAVLAGWTYLTVELGELMTSLDWQIWSLQIVGIIAFSGLLATTLWRLALNRHSGMSEKLRGIFLVFAAAILFWVAFSFHLMSLGTQY